MMLLDSGNSALKWAVEGHQGFRCRGYFLRRNRDFGLLASAAWGHLPVPEAVAVANVAGPLMLREIDNWMQERWRITPCHVRVTAAAAGVVNAYAEPEALGIDRWASLVAARHNSRAPACIIDCGSAITVDALGADGRHQGGVIAPGLGMMRRALSAGTADIDPLPATRPPGMTLLAQGTPEAIENGVSYMASAMIDRVVADIVASLGEQTVVLITGGDAGRLLPLLGWQPQHEPDLVLKGVAILAREDACAT